jgi:hypothetical protein
VTGLAGLGLEFELGLVTGAVAWPREQRTGVVGVVGVVGVGLDLVVAFGQRSVL